MTIEQRRKRVAELTAQIERLMNAKTDRARAIKRTWLKHALTSRARHLRLIEKEEKKHALVGL